MIGCPSLIDCNEFGNILLAQAIGIEPDTVTQECFHRFSRHVAFGWPRNNRRRLLVAHSWLTQGSWEWNLAPSSTFRSIVNNLPWIALFCQHKFRLTHD